MSGNNGTARKIADIVLPPMAWATSRTLGLLAWCFSERKDIALRNLALSFPERSEEWRRRTAFKSIIRMMEMFLVPLVNPLLSDDELSRRHIISPETAEKIHALCQKGKTIFQPPHCAMSEAGVFIPHIIPDMNISTMYRALDWKPAERYVRWARSRWGVGLISRKDGLLEVRRRIGEGENLLILFDQSAGKAGALILSFGRICSATDLPGTLASRFNSSVALIIAKRTGFMRSTIEAHEVENDGSAADITARTSIMFEKLLSEDDELCADWMWSHRRWKCLMSGEGRCLNLRNKKNYVDYSLRVMGLEEQPRRLPYVLRVPEARSKAELLAARMPALRERRKDVRWIAICPEEHKDLFIEGNNCERVIAFAKGGLNAALKDAAKEWTEVYLSFEADSPVHREARLCNALYSTGFSSKAANGRKHKRCTVHGIPESAEEATFDKALDDFFRHCGYEMNE